MSAANTPLRIDLKRDEKLTIAWQDGHTCTYPIAYLRAMCPCATCRQVREQSKPKKSRSLTVLPGNFTTPLAAVKAELVGNYALKITWSDQHDLGIYSYQYLREICPEHGV